MKRLLIAFAAALISPLTLAQPASLDQLLQDIREIRSSEQAAMREREAEFLRERDNQQGLLAEAERELAPIKTEADQLKAEFDRLEQQLTDTEAQMRERSGNLGELFGVVRQMAGDTRSQWQDSLLNVQFPERLAQLDRLAATAQIPTVETLEQFWFMLQEDMTASGQISQISAPVIGRDGQQQEQSVVLVGPFVALAEGEYLSYQSEADTLQGIAAQSAFQDRPVVQLFQVFQLFETGDIRSEPVCQPGHQPLFAEVRVLFAIPVFMQKCDPFPEGLFIFAHAERGKPGLPDPFQKRGEQFFFRHVNDLFPVQHQTAIKSNFPRTNTLCGAVPVYLKAFFHRQDEVQTFLCQRSGETDLRLSPQR